MFQVRLTRTFLALPTNSKGPAVGTEPRSGPLVVGLAVCFETAVSGIDLDIRKCNFFPSGGVAETVGYSLGTARGYLLTRWNNSVMKLRGQSVERRNVKNSFLLKKYLAVLGLHFSTRTFSGCSEWGCSPFAV